jgi:hypothetical protein
MPLSVEDRFAIQDVIHLYAHFHDSKQPQRIAGEIFAEDAVIDFGTGEIKGREAIRAFFGQFDGAFMGTSHNISNLIIEGDADAARCQSKCLAWHWLEKPDVDGKPSLHPADTLAVGGYQDELKRTPEGWRISKRTIVQFGTGLGVGTLDRNIRPVFEGALGRLPEWP